MEAAATSGMLLRLAGGVRKVEEAMGKFAIHWSPPSASMVSRRIVRSSAGHGGGVEHLAFIRGTPWSEEKEEKGGAKPNANEN